MIEDAEEKGLIRPGQTILEPTSGNTGISLAMICSRKGYPLKVVMPENVTPERTQLLKMYGAEIVYSEGSKGSNGAVEKALDMAEQRRLLLHALPVRQPGQPAAHYDGTALEILEELDEVAAFVAGLGTGGTLMGNGRRLKEELGDAVKIVAAEPMQGEPVQGLRSLEDGFIPPIIDLSLLDRKIFVTNTDAIVFTRKLLDEEGLFAGVSSGDRPRGRPDRRRAGRGQRRLPGRRRRLEVPIFWHIHAPHRRDREPGRHRLVVRRGHRGRAAASPGGGRRALAPPAAERWRRAAGRFRRAARRVHKQGQAAVACSDHPAYARGQAGHGGSQGPPGPGVPLDRRLHPGHPAAPPTRIPANQRKQPPGSRRPATSRRLHSC